MHASRQQERRRLGVDHRRAHDVGALLAAVVLRGAVRPWEAAVPPRLGREVVDVQLPAQLAVVAHGVAHHGVVAELRLVAVVRAGRTHAVPVCGNALVAHHLVLIERHELQQPPRALLVAEVGARLHLVVPRLQPAVDLVLADLRQAPHEVAPRVEHVHGVVGVGRVVEVVRVLGRRHGVEQLVDHLPVAALGRAVHVHVLGRRLAPALEPLRGVLEQRQAAQLPDAEVPLALPLRLAALRRRLGLGVGVALAIVTVIAVGVAVVILPAASSAPTRAWPAFLLALPRRRLVAELEPLGLGVDGLLQVAKRV